MSLERYAPLEKRWPFQKFWPVQKRLPVQKFLPAKSFLPRRRLLLLAGLALWPAAAFAHHGWGGFDRSKVLDHSGTVARSAYANPHGTLVMVKDGAELTIELAPVHRMEARGLRPEDIAPGERLRVHAYQNVGNPRVYRAEWVEVSGRRIELR
jgi:hypothetical protein